MSTVHKLSPREAAIIEEHCLRCIAMADAAILNFRQIPPPNRDRTIENNLIYWSNCRSALKWAIAQARQRSGVPLNVV